MHGRDEHLVSEGARVEATADRVADDLTEAGAAFTDRYHQHLDGLWRFVRRRCASPQEADDLTAEVFAIAWRRRLDLPPDDEVRLWLFGTARRVLANHHRGGRRRERLHLRLAAQPPPAPSAGHTREAGLWAALAALSDDDRELLLLRAWDELPVTDIATLLGCTPNAASLRLHKARARLSAALDAAGGTDGRGSRTPTGRSPQPRGGTP